MKSIQTIALLLWMIIFVVAAFILGQFLVSKDIFDITEIIIGQTSSEDRNVTQTDDSSSSTNKVGKETVRIGLNIANDYFEKYYKEYINYIISNSEIYHSGKKIFIGEDLASDYVFYAMARNIDTDKYTCELSGDKIVVTEAEANSFIDKMFAKEISEILMNDYKNGYDRTSRKYNIEKNNKHSEFIQELSNIQNVTSNELILAYICKNGNEHNVVKLTVVYKGGRYIVTEVLKEN